MSRGVQITVQVKNNRVVYQSVKRIGDALPKLTKRVMKNIMSTARYEASGRYSGGASYGVPERPGQTYQRTGTYGSSFKVVDNGGKSYTLKSDAVQRGRHYTQYVGGNYLGENQAGVHRGRWPLIFEALKKWAQMMTTEIKQTLSEIIRGQGVGL